MNLDVVFPLVVVRASRVNVRVFLLVHLFALLLAFFRVRRGQPHLQAREVVHVRLERRLRRVDEPVSLDPRRHHLPLFQLPIGRVVPALHVVHRRLPRGHLLRPERGARGRLGDTRLRRRRDAAAEVAAVTGVERAVNARALPRPVIVHLQTLELGPKLLLEVKLASSVGQEHPRVTRRREPVPVSASLRAARL